MYAVCVSKFKDNEIETTEKVVYTTNDIMKISYGSVNKSNK